MTAYCSSPAALVLQLLDSTGTVVGSLDLMDQANSYRVESLELAWPAVRELKADLPTRDGTFDTTMLFGERVVTVVGSLVPSPAQGSREAALQTLAGWVAPALRPRLLFAVDGDRPPMTIGLRGSQLASPFTNPTVSAFTVSWVAADPVAYAAAGKTTTILAVATATGRTYNLTFPRVYAGSGGSGIGQAVNAGSYQTWPTFTVYGPCTNPAIYYGAGRIVTATLTVAAGDYVVFNTRAATVFYNGDPAASRYSSVDFVNTTWAPLPPGTTQIRFAPQSASAPAQVVAAWNDAYLT